MSYFVDVQGVTHVYGGGDGTPAVEDLTVRVRQGEFAAIVESEINKLIGGKS
jgi:NitT/TauT family transport system ATP-binding protein